MASPGTRPPVVPPDYYERIRDAEELHYWYVGMRSISRALLRETLARGGLRVLDAGCGTGGFLRWLLEEGRFASAAGVDIGAEAIAIARERVPEADLRVSPLDELPFADAAFDLVVTNDVLQHVREDRVALSLRELRRVLAPEGILLVRTNGARRTRRERVDWRAYDRMTLERHLLRAGFALERITYANAVLSLWAAAAGRVPHAPTDTSHGIPLGPPSRAKSLVGRLLLSGEARYLSRSGRRLPYGHTQFVLARAAEA